MLHFYRLEVVFTVIGLVSRNTKGCTIRSDELEVYSTCNYILRYWYLKFQKIASKLSIF